MVGIFNLDPQRSINTLNNNFNQLVELQNRLATGKQINKASDGPAALVISERLQAEFSAFKQGIENIQRTDNVLSTAEGALNETSSLLREARSLVQQSSAALSPEERDVIQNELDNVLGSIDRIGNTSSFGQINLLDGTQQPRVANVSEGIENIRVDEVRKTNDLPRDIQVEITDAGERAQSAGTISDQSGDVSVRISGQLGSATFDFADGTSITDVESAINAHSATTGIEAVGGRIRSVREGTHYHVSIEELSGTFDGIGEGYYTGQDIQGTVNGTVAIGSGNTLTVNNGSLDASIQFDPDANVGSFSFRLESSGFDVNLGTDASQQGIGIERIATDSLGVSSGVGRLNTLYSGGSNALSNNPVNALEIIDAAIDETSGLRGRLGAYQANTLQSTENSLTEAATQIEASRSRIQDADYARTISEAAEAQIRQQAQVALQAQVQGLNRNVLMGLLLA